MSIYIWVYIITGSYLYIDGLHMPYVEGTHVDITAMLQNKDRLCSH